MGSSSNTNASGDDGAAAAAGDRDLDDSNFLLWKCPICLDTLERPVLTTCCGQSFCDACLNSALAKVDACPMCREPLLAGTHSATRNRALEDILARLPAYVRDRGCDYAADADLEHHVLIQIDRDTSAERAESGVEHAPSRPKLCSSLTRVRTQLERLRIQGRARSCCTAMRLRQWRHWCRVHWSSLQCAFYVVLFFVFVSFLRVQEDEFTEHQQ